MEAEVFLDGVRAEEDGSLSGDHQDEAVQGLQGDNTSFLYNDHNCRLQV